MSRDVPVGGIRSVFLVVAVSVVFSLLVLLRGDFTDALTL